MPKVRGDRGRFVWLPEHVRVLPAAGRVAPAAPFSGPRPLPEALPDPWRRVRPDGWEEIYDPESGQWLAGDQPDDDAAPDAGFAEWDESKHSRGQPENAGQFGPGGYGGAQPQAPAGGATAAKPDPREARRDKARERRARERAAREAETAARLARPAEVHDYLKPEAQRALNGLFPEGFRGEDAPTLVGAPPGSRVSVYQDPYSPGVSIQVEHPHIKECSRRLSADRQGRLLMRNSMFFLKKAQRGSGLGLRVFSEEVRTLAALGVDRIETCAGKGGIMNGYYTWPRLGYDAPLDEDFVGRIYQRAQRLFESQGESPDEAAIRAETLANHPVSGKPATVLDLMATADGRAYWKKYGEMGGMTFDLKPGSRSLAVLNDYLKSKGKPAVEVDAEKVNALKAERAAIPARLRQEADAKRLAAVAPDWHRRLEGTGLDPAAVDRKAAENEAQALAMRRDNPTGAFGSSNPAEIRFGAYSRAVWSLAAARHAERMASADPALAGRRAEFEREAARRGLDPARVRELAAQTPIADADAAYALARAYQHAMDALPGMDRARRETSAAATFAAWDEGKHPRGQPANAGQFGPGGYGGAAAAGDPSQKGRGRGGKKRTAPTPVRSAPAAPPPPPAATSRTDAETTAELNARADEVISRMRQAFADAKTRIAARAESPPPPAAEAPPPESRLSLVEGQPARPLTAAGHRTADAMLGAVAQAPGLSDGQREAYGDAVRRVCGNMPDAAHGLVAQNLESSHFYADQESLNGGIFDAIEAAIPRWLRWASAPLDYLLFGSKAKQREFTVALSGTVAAYFPWGRSLHLDGDSPGATYDVGAAETGMGRVGGLTHSHLYAHELGHAIDGPRTSLSRHPDWKRAWKEEIATGGEGNRPLTDYAATVRTEGFAEFARLLYGGGVTDLAKVRELFPKCSKFFEERGLWPA